MGLLDKSFFKLFFQIAKKNKLSIILALIFSIFFPILMTGSNMSSSLYKPNIYLVDNDNTVISGLIKDSISEDSKLVTLKKSMSIEDALLSKIIDAYIEIPKGFTDSFVGTQDVKLTVDYLSGTTKSAFINSNISGLLNKFRTYLINSNGDLEKFYKFLDNKNSIIDLKVVSANETNVESENISKTIFVYRFLSYGIFSGIVPVIAVFFMIIRENNIKSRYLCSPITTKKYLSQLTYATILFSAVFISIISIVSIISFKLPINDVFLLNVANIFCYGLFSVSFGLLVGFIAKKSSMITAISTGISLILSFISGIFVPMEFLSDGIKNIASFTPTYWYSLAVENINTLDKLNYQNIFVNLGIQILFSVAIFCVVLVIINDKKKSHFNFIFKS